MSVLITIAACVSSTRSTNRPPGLQFSLACALFFFLFSHHPLASPSAAGSLLPRFLRLALAQLFARGARLRAVLGNALGGASRGRSRRLMHAECSRRRPTCTEDDRSGLPASRLQLQRSSLGSMYSHAQVLCMHDSARMTQPARRTRSTTLTRLHVGASYLHADTANKICRPSVFGLKFASFANFLPLSTNIVISQAVCFPCCYIYIYM